MSNIIENIRWALKDIEEWVEDAKMFLDDSTKILQELREVNDADEEEKTYEAIHVLGIKRGRIFLEMVEQLIKIRGTYLRKYEDRLLEKYLITREENLKTLNNIAKKKKTDFHLLHVTLLSVIFFLHKTILFYTKRVCIASNVKKLLINRTYNLSLVKMEVT